MRPSLRTVSYTHLDVYKRQDYSNANKVYMRRDDNGDPLTNQKRWERDIEAKYVVQSGSLKDMSFRIRQATTRATDFELSLIHI